MACGGKRKNHRSEHSVLTLKSVDLHLASGAGLTRNGSNNMLYNNTHTKLACFTSKETITDIGRHKRS